MLDDALPAAAGVLGWAVADDAAGAAVLPFELRLLEQAVAARAIPAAMTAAENRFLTDAPLWLRASGSTIPRRPRMRLVPIRDHVRCAVPVQRDIVGKKLTKGRS